MCLWEGRVLRSSETLEKPGQRVRGFLELVTLEQDFLPGLPSPGWAWINLGPQTPLFKHVNSIILECGVVGRERVSRWDPRGVGGRRRRCSFQTVLSKQILEVSPSTPPAHMMHDEG